ncbi:D-alanyl-D-alanine carboxypeptidase family protein [Lachnospira pectinoschiza]|uniref:D-alanyl-D-alanine carboxypeptidase n=1 Tax=Lachnospira pectinoschiza TaxID=28052 RepID=A0A1G9YQ78_9FIRM|nr:D-alanyl-D-alanine carboxypeptidase family protein [Lachnospira pectinoschiza]SDN11222.1 D-alanyl-D-alanine carboxypeptidase [Lachnospira pectinoschiza]
MFRFKKYLKRAAALLGTAALLVSSPIQTFAALSSTGSVVSSVDTSSTTWPSAPDVSAGSCILIDADTGSILYEKNAYEKCYPASTTKILTGLLTIENCSMSDIVTFSKEAVESVNITEDANLGTKEGEQYTVEQALYGMLLYSANEIAYGLAEHVAGDLESFVDMMNAKAAEVGALNTHFANASGLYDENHYTTAYDMAMIARACYNNATFVSIDSTYTTYTIPATNKTDTARTFKHRHKMLYGREYYYEYCKGGKTGFTDESQYTLVTFAEKDGMRLICVTFQEPDDASRFVDTKALFEWGFENFTKTTTSSSNISSLLTNDTIYTSDVFTSRALNYNLTASFITIPNSGSSSDVTVAIDDNYDLTNDNGDLTVHLKYLFGENVVGTTTLTISSNDSTNTSLLPYLEESDSSSNYTAKKCLRINLWILLGVIAFAIILAFVIKNYNSNSRRRRRHASKRKLRF